MFVSIASSPLVRLIVCPLSAGSKSIVSPLLASASAWRSEPSPPSFVFVTVMTAPCADIPIAQSRPKEMARRVMAAVSRSYLELGKQAIQFPQGTSVLRQPVAVHMRRNLRWFDFATPAPEHVCVRHGDLAHMEMLINRRLVLEQESLIRAVRHSHDVDVPKFRTGFAPVAMR